MSKIALRIYNTEINDMIDQEQVDVAIAHCLHVLNTYPKYVETYRLLGKAYLEAKQFENAADVFQRVLSSHPDDFVANVGMSVVGESNEDYDSAELSLRASILMKQLKNEVNNLELGNSILKDTSFL